MIESASAIASSGLFLSASFHLLQSLLVSEMNHDDDSVPIALEAYEKMAEQYAARVETKPHNAYVDRPTVFSLLPEIRGKAVLDAGCGPRIYSKHLVEKGAQVVAVDVSPKMTRPPSTAGFHCRWFHGSGCCSSCS